MNVSRATEFEQHITLPGTRCCEWQLMEAGKQNRAKASNFIGMTDEAAAEGRENKVVT